MNSPETLRYRIESIESGGQVAIDARATHTEGAADISDVLAVGDHLPSGIDASSRHYAGASADAAPTTSRLQAGMGPFTVRSRSNCASAPNGWKARRRAAVVVWNSSPSNSEADVAVTEVGQHRHQMRQRPAEASRRVITIVSPSSA